MQPSPSAETSRSLFPSLRFCIISPIYRLDSRAMEAVSRFFRFIAYFSGGRAELFSEAHLSSPEEATVPIPHDPPLDPGVKMRENIRDTWRSSWPINST